MPLKRTPLLRKTPLRNRKPLTGHRSVPENRKPAPESPPLNREAARRALANQAASAAAPRREHAPVPEVSKRASKPSNTGFPPVVRVTILDRDQHRCQRCGKSIESASAVYSLQHRDNRGQGGTTDPRINLPSNGATLCGSGTTECHGWVEEHETEAARNGWVVRSWADPESVPMRTPDGWVRIDAAGNRWLTAEPLHGDAHAVARRKEPAK